MTHSSGLGCSYDDMLCNWFCDCSWCSCCLLHLTTRQYQHLKLQVMSNHILEPVRHGFDMRVVLHALFKSSRDFEIKGINKTCCFKRFGKLEQAQIAVSVPCKLIAVSTRVQSSHRKCCLSVSRILKSCPHLAQVTPRSGRWL